MYHVKYATDLRSMADFAYPIAFTPFLVSNFMRTAVPCIILPCWRKRERRAEKGLVSMAN